MNLRLTANILAIRGIFVLGLVVFLVSLPLYWVLDFVDEEGKRFPGLWKITGETEFMFKNLSYWCAVAEDQARHREIANIDRQIAKEFES